MRTILFLLLLIAAAAGSAWWNMIRMPGHSYVGIPPPLSADQIQLRDGLVADVRALAGEIGERNTSRYPQLQAAADYIEKSFASAGFAVEAAGARDTPGARPIAADNTSRYIVRRYSYDVDGKRCDNIEAEIGGSSPEVVVVGAHYDSVIGSPAANDNGSGVAALLALARRFAVPQPATAATATRTLRFVAFPNEEQPHFLKREMGSLAYASRCHARGDNIGAMISLETIGYYSGASGSQHYPLPGLRLFYPTRGTFIAFVGNISSRALVRQTIGAFREHATVPSEGAALPSGVPGVGWSDHWSFWQFGYPAVMVTDTAPFRYPHYHLPTDTPDKLDYDSMARAVAGVQQVIAALCRPAG